MASLTYPMKYIVNVKRYWFPVIFKSVVNPSSFALPTTLAYQFQYFHYIFNVETDYCFYPRKIADTAKLEAEGVSNPTFSIEPSHWSPLDWWRIPPLTRMENAHLRPDSRERLSRRLLWGWGSSSCTASQRWESQTPEKKCRRDETASNRKLSIWEMSQ